MRKSQVICYHDKASHFGSNKTIEGKRKEFYFPNMRRYVKIHIKNCVGCILSKQKSGMQESELHPVPPGRRPFEIIHIDHLGPLPITPRKNTYVLGIIDNLTKYVTSEAVKSVHSVNSVKN